MSEFLTNFAEAANVVDTDLQMETRLVDLPNWDSLAILMTISMLDMDYGVNVTGTELQNCATVGDIHSLMEGKRS
ncbi:MAG: acyl carrier protein [Puniceicoccaceae bacterium]